MAIGAYDYPVLVVDDDPATLAMLKTHVSAAGHPVHEAANGREALQLLRDHRLRFVVADWMMPDMTGLEMCRRVRIDAEIGFVYFIMATMQAETTHLVEAFNAGVDDYIVKPVEQLELVSRLRAGLRFVQLHDRLVAQKASVTRLNVELEDAVVKLRHASETDELTKLPNRRLGFARLDDLWSLGAEKPYPLACAVIDVDHFKRINDRFGHPQGDAALRHVAAVLQRTVRPSDLLCRMGGEEFLLLMPNQSLESACVTVERCRAAVASSLLPLGASATKVTISAGVAVRGELEDNQAAAPHMLVALADRRMYDAKSAGRDRVTPDLTSQPAEPGKACEAA